MNRAVHWFPNIHEINFLNVNNLANEGINNWFFPLVKDFPVLGPNYPFLIKPNLKISPLRA